MTFEIHSNITNRSMTVAARAMRRVLWRKRSIIWAIFGWTVFFINALLLIPFDGEPFALDVRTVTSLLVEVMLLSVLLFQDRFKGMIARKNTPGGPGVKFCVSDFRQSQEWRWKAGRILA